MEMIIVLTPEFVQMKSNKYTRSMAPNSTKIEIFYFIISGRYMTYLMTTKSTSTIRMGAMMLKSSNADGKMIANNTLFAI